MKLKQSVALQRLSKSFIERLYEDGKIQEAFMAEHINQLYDYLSDKESLEKLTSPEFIKALKKENDIQYEINHPTLSDKEEASKRECICEKLKDAGREVGIKTNSLCPKHGGYECPPQQEESRGECEHCHMSLSIRNPSGYCDHLQYPSYCDHCNITADIFSKPQLKEESPKEDEIGKILELLLEVLN